LNPTSGEKIWTCKDVSLGGGIAILAAVGQSTQASAAAAKELEQEAASAAAAASAT
jgi:hypothetical protein